MPIVGLVLRDLPAPFRCESFIPARHYAKRVYRSDLIIQALYVPKDRQTLVYIALVQPYFYYCSLVWQNCKSCN